MALKVFFLKTLSIRLSIMNQKQLQILVITTPLWLPGMSSVIRREQDLHQTPLMEVKAPPSGQYSAFLCDDRLWMKNIILFLKSKAIQNGVIFFSLSFHLLLPSFHVPPSGPV